VSVDDRSGKPLRVVGLFAGIGGIEAGLHEAGHETVLLCEVWDAAQVVLRERFPGTPLIGDVAEIDELPECELVAAGFPCQDLSQAGRTAGIKGGNSGLVRHVFRLVDGSEPEWLLFENVPFMLQLDRGAAMDYLTDELTRREYAWAYRVVDTRAFGLPQRRKRVVLLAARDHDPRSVLFADHARLPLPPDEREVACGFYWTEGIRGLGWAVDAVPTLKGGSTIGIPSPPAIRLPEGEGIVLPEIRDAERLQGFEADWTRPAEELQRGRGIRWKLVGNAVSVPVAAWVGERLRDPQAYVEPEEPVEVVKPWPTAAWGRDGRAFVAPEISQAPLAIDAPHLLDFLKHPTTPLSERATAGFLGRTGRSSLRFPEGFVDDITAHLEAVRAEKLAA
jgi:DNA (cytosine-5)-methyltransferase 1